ncbi:MAG: dihydrofolate reductase [Bacteroidales bacterium]|nr:dihydrofolate reductase [Bacteroidales bacterium]
MKNISIIVAVAENNAIGKDNKLLWHISDDLKRFKKLTTGHIVIMGKKTFDSLPNGALPNRTNIVITDDINDRFEDCIMAYSIEDALDKSDDNKEIFIIGGGSIYKQFLKYANKLYLTKVHKSFEGDVFFPEIDINEWKLIEQVNFEPDDKTTFAYSYLIYKKLK